MRGSISYARESRIKLIKLYQIFSRKHLTTLISECIIAHNIVSTCLSRALRLLDQKRFSINFYPQRLRELITLQAGNEH